MDCHRRAPFRHVGGLELIAELAAYRLVPDLLTESIEKPPTRSKSTARAPPLITRRPARRRATPALGRERAEERQRHVDAVELIDVVLTAAARARAAHAVLREYCTAGINLSQIAIFLADRKSADLACSTSRS